MILDGESGANHWQYCQGAHFRERAELPCGVLADSHREECPLRSHKADTLVLGQGDSCFNAAVLPAMKQEYQVAVLLIEQLS
jgi:hypothetical protein